MRIRSYLRTAGVGMGIFAVMSAVSLGFISPASADTGCPANVSVCLAQWYPTYYDCVYAGDVYAQQGVIYNFTCTPENGGWVLIGW